MIKQKRERHGHTSNNGIFSPTYISWIAMKQRCYNKNHTAYDRYGGIGITVCDKWKNSFINFLADMGERPVGMTLDRIDPSKGYYSDNCKWSTSKQQMNNLKKQYITFDNETLHISELCKKYGVSKNELHLKLYSGISLNDILTLKMYRNRPLCENFKNDLPDVSRNEKIEWLYKKGCTQVSIGKYFGICKQNVNAILKKIKKSKQLS